MYRFNKAKSKGSINTYVQFQLLKTKKITMKKLQPMQIQKFILNWLKQIEKIINQIW